MIKLKLSRLLTKKDLASVIAGLLDAIPAPIGIYEEDHLIAGAAEGGREVEFPVSVNGQEIGWVAGAAQAKAVADLLSLIALRNTERRELGRETLDLYKELNFFYDFSEEIGTVLEIDELARLLLGGAMKWVSGTSASVILVNEETKELEMVASGGRRKPDQACDSEADFVAHVVSTGKAEIVNDVPNDPRCSREARWERSLICVPLKTKDRVVGVLKVASESPHHYSARDLKFLNTLASHTAGPIANAKLYQLILNMNPEFMMTTIGGEIEYINKRFLAFIGFDTLKAFKREYPNVECFFAGLETFPYQAVSNGFQVESFVQHVDREPVIKLKGFGEKQGKSLAFWVTYNKFPDLDKYIFIFTDITKIEKEKMQEKMAALGGLVAWIAHELNTPVGIGVTAASHITAKLETLREAFENQRLTVKAMAGFIEDCETSQQLLTGNLARTSQLIDKFKKIAIYQIVEHKRKFPVKAFIEDVVRSLATEFLHAQHKVTVDCAPDVEINTYPESFTQIVTHLVSNSIAHGYDSGKSGSLQFKIHATDNTFQMTYSDDGRGIQTAHQRKIFEPFFTTRRVSGGSGLGLHIVYNIVTQRMGGTIECRSEQRRGATFLLQWPR